MRNEDSYSRVLNALAVEAGRGARSLLAVGSRRDKQPPRPPRRPRRPVKDPTLARS